MSSGLSIVVVAHPSDMPDAIVTRPETAATEIIGESEFVLPKIENDCILRIYNF